MKTNYNTGAAPLYKATKKIETERDLLKKVMKQIAEQKRGSLSRRLAQAVLDFSDMFCNELDRRGCDTETSEES